MEQKYSATKQLYCPWITNNMLKLDTDQPYITVNYSLSTVSNSIGYLSASFDGNSFSKKSVIL